MMKMMKVKVLLLVLVMAGGVASGALVEWLKFDSAVGGVSPAAIGTAATLYTTATIDASGKVGGALLLDGTGQISDDPGTSGNGCYVDIVGYKGIAGAGARTISVWIQADATQPMNTPVITSWGSKPTNGMRYDLRLSNNTGEAGISGPGRLRNEVAGGYIVGTAATLDLRDGNWHHVALTYSGGALANTTLYIDGVAIATQGNTGITVNTGAVYDVRIGTGIHDAEARYFKGRMDEYQLYDEALTAGQIKQLADNPGIPEPATMLLLGVGGLFAMKIRRKS